MEQEEESYPDVDFQYVYIDDLKPGMIINHTTVKGCDGENFLICEINIKEAQDFSYWGQLVVLTDEGKPEVLEFAGSSITDRTYQFRVIKRGNV